MSTTRWPATLAGGDGRLHVPPLRAAALCDLGLVAGPLCASLSSCFRWVPASRRASDAAGRGWRGPGPWGEGGPEGDVTQAFPGQAGGQGGAGQVAAATRAGAPAAPESSERAPHRQVCGWG